MISLLSRYQRFSDSLCVCWPVFFWNYEEKYSYHGRCFYFFLTRYKTSPNHAFLERFFKTIGENVSWTVGLSLAQINSFLLLLLLELLLQIDYWWLLSPRRIPRHCQKAPGMGIIASRLRTTVLCWPIILVFPGLRYVKALVLKSRHLEANWEDQPPNKWNFISCLSGGCCERALVDLVVVVLPVFGFCKLFLYKHVCFSPSLYPSRGIGKVTYLREASWVGDQRECWCVCACIRDRDRELGGVLGGWTLEPIGGVR